MIYLFLIIEEINDGENESIMQQLTNFKSLTSNSSSIQPTNIVLLEHSYTTKDNLIQNETTDKSTFTTANYVTQVAEDKSKTDLEKIVLQQAALIQVLQKEYWDALKKCNPSKRLAGDDEQTNYYTGYHLIKSLSCW